MIPIATLVKIEERIHEVFPDAKVYVSSGMDYGFCIQVEIDGNGGTYRVQREFTGLEMNSIKNKDMLFEYFADESINMLKKKGFKARE